MKDNPILQREGAGIKAAMNDSLNAHPDEAPCHFSIDTSATMAAQRAAIALSCERGKKIMLLYPDPAEPGEAGTP